MTKHTVRIVVKGICLLALIVPPGVGLAQETERVVAIKLPGTPLPDEAQSRNVTKFSFISYGDTRGRRDGTAIQYEHSLIVDSMLGQIKKLQDTEYPVRFILQSGDAVVDGRKAQQWNVSFVPLINRLTMEGGVSYFLAPGNHDVTHSGNAEDPERKVALHNYLDAVGSLIPPDGSPRRLSGYPTYSLGYGNTFVLGFDANIAGDEKQFRWVKAQLEEVDRKRYVNIIVFCHQAPFSSGPHGGPTVEEPTIELRNKYMPLFRASHVRAVFSGHEHLFRTLGRALHGCEWDPSHGPGGLRGWWGANLRIHRRAEAGRVLEGKRSQQGRVETSRKTGSRAGSESVPLPDRPRGRREAGHASHSSGLGRRIRAVSQQQGFL